MLLFFVAAERVTTTNMWITYHFPANFLNQGRQSPLSLHYMLTASWPNIHFYIEACR